MVQNGKDKNSHSRSKSKERKASKAADKNKGNSEDSNNKRSRKVKSRTEEKVARATQLAANLSQLLITLPPERLGPTNLSGEAAVERNESDHLKFSRAAFAAGIERNIDSSSQDSPSKSDTANLISDKQHNANQITAVVTERSKPTRHQSTTEGRRSLQDMPKRQKSMEVSRKQIHQNPFAMDTLSKSFEKLDLINQRHDRLRRGRGANEVPGDKDAEGGDVMVHSPMEKKIRHSRHHEKRSKRSHTKEIKDSENSGVAGKEVTIAKVGRFKFSLELNKKFDEESTFIFLLINSSIFLY